MEEEKKVIFSLEFDTDEGLKRAADFRSAIDADKASLSELNKTIKEHGEATKEQALQREKLEKAIRENTRSRSEELRAVDAYIKATKGATDANGNYNGSIKQLRGALAYMTEQWNGLNKEERENAAIGGVLQKETKRLSDQLKELEGSVGDNRRSVGGYLDAIRSAPGAMGKFRAGIDGISTAMKANPLGLIVSLLPMITQLFNSSGEGADFFAKAMSIVNAVVQEGLKRVVALGGAMFKLLTGDVKGAWEEGKAAVTGFSDAVNTAVKAGGALADRMDALENAESRFTVTSAKAKKQIDELLIQARNRTTSEGERIKLLEKAEKIEVQVNKQAMKLAKERLALIQEENKIKQSDEDEELKRVDEQNAKIIELERESANIQEKIQVRKDAIADQAAEREKKRQEERAKLEKQYKEKQEQALKETAAFQEELEKIAADKEKELKEARLEGLQKEFEANEVIRKKANEEREKELKLEKEISDQKIAIKQAEYDSARALAQAGTEVFAVLANENSEFLAFQKALTGLQIAIDSAQAISKLTASSMEVSASVAKVSGPLGVITGPLAYAAYYGTQIATLFASFAKAKQLLSSGSVPTYKAAEGGLLSGPSHAEGGIRGTGAFGNVEVEGDEAIINKRSTAMFLPILSAINQLGGGKALAPTYYGAAGGLIPGSVYGKAYALNSGAMGVDYKLLAKELAIANKSQPIYVIPTEIRDKANAADARKATAGLGYKP